MIGTVSRIVKGQTLLCEDSGVQESAVGWPAKDALWEMEC